MKDKHFQAWEKLRKKGRIRFVFVRGILGWGLPMFLIMIFAFNGSKDGVIHAVIWTIGGSIFGFTMWYLSEKKYIKEVKRRKEYKK